MRDSVVRCRRRVLYFPRAGRPRQQHALRALPARPRQFLPVFRRGAWRVQEAMRRMAACSIEVPRRHEPGCEHKFCDQKYLLCFRMLRADVRCRCSAPGFCHLSGSVFDEDCRQHMCCTGHPLGAGGGLPARSQHHHVQTFAMWSSELKPKQTNIISIAAMPHDQHQHQHHPVHCRIRHRPTVPSGTPCIVSRFFSTMAPHRVCVLSVPGRSL